MTKTDIIFFSFWLLGIGVFIMLARHKLNISHEHKPKINDWKITEYENGECELEIFVEGWDADARWCKLGTFKSVEAAEQNAKEVIRGRTIKAIHRSLT